MNPPAPLAVVLKKYDRKNSYEKFDGRKRPYTLSPRPLAVTHVLLAVYRTCERVSAHVSTSFFK